MTVAKRRPCSDALVNESGKEGRINHEVAELGVEGRRRFGRNRIITRTPLLFECGYIFADGDKHVPKLPELGFGADSFAMASDDNGVVGDRGEIGIGCRDHPVDAAARRIVDKWINAVPESVCHVDHIRFGKRHGDVAVGMRGPIMFKRDRQSVELEGMLVSENFAGDAAFRQCKEIVVPIVNTLDLGKILSRVLLRDDFGARRIEPGVAAGVVEVPVCINKVG